MSRRSRTRLKATQDERHWGQCRDDGLFPSTDMITQADFAVFSDMHIMVHCKFKMGRWSCVRTVAIRILCSAPPRVAAYGLRKVVARPEG